MILRLIIGEFIALMLSCTNHETASVLKGDLYFNWIRLGSFYNIPDSGIMKFETMMDTLRVDKLGEDDKLFVETYKKLIKGNLIYKPFVDLMIKKDSVVKLYLDSADYDRIKTYKWQRLHDEKKKVIIEATVKEISKGFFYCTSLKSVELTDGETFPRNQRKLKIDDYN
jgi:hypothetical protein